MSQKPEPSGPEKIIFQGKTIEVVEQPMQAGDKGFTLEFARRSPGVRLIVPTLDGNILLTKEYRPELTGYDYRLTGGKVLDTLAEYNAFLQTGVDIKIKAEEAALREAKEELGIIVKSVDLFAISRCGLTIEWDLYYFIVKEYEQSTQELEELEDITVTPTPIQETRAMCLDGRMQEERSALILLQYLEK
ncbi:MAG: NUDIX domain-containing protein [Minisyncoccia bacterium]